LQQRQQLSDIRHDAQMREERAANRPLLLTVSIVLLKSRVQQRRPPFLFKESLNRISGAAS
jgi:hypothetical protein